MTKVRPLFRIALSFMRFIPLLVYIIVIVLSFIGLIGLNPLPSSASKYSCVIAVFRNRLLLIILYSTTDSLDNVDVGAIANTISVLYGFSQTPLLSYLS